MTRYLAELAPIPHLIAYKLPPAATDVWLITRYGTGYRGRYDAQNTDVVAWCALPKLTDEQKERLRK